MLTRNVGKESHCFRSIAGLMMHSCCRLCSDLQSPSKSVKDPGLDSGPLPVFLGLLFSRTRH